MTHGLADHELELDQAQRATALDTNQQHISTTTYNNVPKDTCKSHPVSRDLSEGSDSIRIIHYSRSASLEETNGYHRWLS